MAIGITTRRLAEVIFEEFLPKEILEKYDRDIFGKRLTVKDRFISHFEAKLMVPRYDEEISKIILLEIAEKKISAQKDFLNYSTGEDGSSRFDFSVFDPLFRSMNFLERNSRGL